MNQQNQEVKQNNELLGKMDELGDRSSYHNLVDILFVLDTTGSMGWCISQLKKTVCKIMKKFSDKQYNIKFAIGVYRDHPPQQYSYVDRHFDLRNQEAIIEVIDDECEVGGGGDTPQAVFDGLVNSLKKTSWRISTDGKTKSKRFLFHGCDAPPHGIQYGANSSDKSWEKNGCPCGLTRHHVKELLEQYNVDYSLIKCGTQVDVAAQLFKQCFGSRFKRELEIKHSYGRPRKDRGIRKGGRIQARRKRSVQYMAEIQRQQMESSGSSRSHSSDSINSSKSRRSCRSRSIKRKTATNTKGKQQNLERKRSVCSSSSSEQKKGINKRKKNKKSKRRKSISDDSYDSEGNRSMASLVLSDIEDGVGDYFEDQQIKKQKKQKAINKQV